MTYKKLLDLIDLDYVGLENVKKLAEKGYYNEAMYSFFDYFRNRKNVNLYLTDNDIENISKYSMLNFNEEVKETIKVANEVRNNTFLFRFKWDMERTNEPVQFYDEIKWDKVPFNDEEWVFMLNRHRYWIALGQAYALTKDSEYALIFFSQICNWIDNNPCISKFKKSTWRTIESGIRCENWIKTYQYFKDSHFLTTQIFSKILLSLYEHGEYIFTQYDDSRKLSNWGVLENHGLFMLSVFLPELKVSKLWRKESLNRLKESINLQVMRDGMQWEQSPMYHNEVLHCYLDTIILARRNNIHIPEDIIKKTKALAYADLYMAKPNHRQPMQSDSDDTDVRDMITKAAYIFNDGGLKFGAYSYIDFDSIWDLGWDSVEIYKAMDVKEPEHTSYGFEDSGNYYMRSGWKQDDNYLYFHCGTLGSGHGHADLLHFDIHAHGESILIDPGRYTYIEGNPIRDYLKSCKAHNTTLVDDEDFTGIDGSWKYSKAAWPIKQSFIAEEEFDYVEGGHLGYMNLKDSVYVNRKIIFVKPNYWILVDEFYAKAQHNYKEVFQFDKGKVNNEKYCVEFIGKKAKLKLFPINKEVSKYIEEGYISKEYNKLDYGKKLTLSLDNSGFTSMISVLYSEKIENRYDIKCEKIKIYKSDGKLVEDEEAEAIKIKINEDEEHMILVAHGEAFKGKKLYMIDGVAIYGKVVLIKRINGETKIINIRY